MQAIPNFKVVLLKPWSELDAKKSTARNAFLDLETDTLKRKNGTHGTYEVISRNALHNEFPEYEGIIVGDIVVVEESAVNSKEICGVTYHWINSPQYIAFTLLP
jgi:hypothetical protein